MQTKPQEPPPFDGSEEAAVPPEAVLDEWRKRKRWGVVEVEFVDGIPRFVREHRQRKGK